MLLKIKGKPFEIRYPIVGRVTFSPEYEGEILIAKDHFPDDVSRYAAVLTNSRIDQFTSKQGVYEVPSFEHLTNGDIVVVNPDGVINTQYRVHSTHNFLLFTERCNSNCLMCSQPPKNREDTAYLYHIYSQLIPLIPKDCKEIGITGGEPTLMGTRFFSLLEQLQMHLPATDVHCLTNGRTFAWNNIARKLGEMSFDKLMLGIPIYSDTGLIHDYVVQAKGAFDQTIKGLYNLARYDIRLELRIVLHKPTLPRLLKLSKFIYKNLPFVEHVAFMGLENQGYTPHNIDKLWIDPVEYGEDLSEAMIYLSEHGMNVSLYNAQLCVTPEEIWQFSRRSISDWKNVYLNECENCSKKIECGGFFSSNVSKHSLGIRAFC